jgi:hypothetical protein
MGCSMEILQERTCCVQPIVWCWCWEIVTAWRTKPLTGERHTGPLSSTLHTGTCIKLCTLSCIRLRVVLMCFAYLSDRASVCTRRIPNRAGIQDQNIEHYKPDGGSSGPLLLPTGTSLPGNQEKLALAILALKKPTATVLIRCVPVH